MLCEVGLGDEAARHAAHLMRASDTLTQLSLCNNCIGTLGMAALGMCTHCVHAHSACALHVHCFCTAWGLRMPGTCITCALHEHCTCMAGEALATNCSLRLVNLRSNHCGDAGVFAFSEVSIK